MGLDSPGQNTSCEELNRGLLLADLDLDDRALTGVGHVQLGTC